LAFQVAETCGISDSIIFDSLIETSVSVQIETSFALDTVAYLVIIFAVIDNF